jgi:hypothetical protein
MAITATSTPSNSIEPIEPGTYAARCYSMVHIGTNEEEIQGTKKTLNKVRMTFELPTELFVFKEENGEQPRVISKEFTLSMHEKSTLRPFLQAWRGQDFTEEEAQSFDVLKLLGVPCLLTIINKTSGKGKNYATITGASKLLKGMTAEEQINETFIFDYNENFSIDKIEDMPDFISEKIYSSIEFSAMQDEGEQLTPEEVINAAKNEKIDPLEL